jgi:hypothetical protein
MGVAFHVIFLRESHSFIEKNEMVRDERIIEDCLYLATLAEASFIWQVANSRSHFI